ncbi:hypothetical protein [Candidatus Leptofilum sp.]|uniref:hypothetical protein n=1 Tax=Candidatus Leptofilum sp. TaxID=3241576 RepID=UPI003B5B4CAF
MKIQRKLLLFAMVLLLFSMGMVVAQSSTNYRVPRSVISSGGTADSANYTVTAAIGQPVTGIIDGSNYKGSIGFLLPAYDLISPPGGSGHMVYFPIVMR